MASLVRPTPPSSGGSTPASINESPVRGESAGYLRRGARSATRPVRSAATALSSCPIHEPHPKREQEDECNHANYPGSDTKGDPDDEDHESDYIESKKHYEDAHRTGAAAAGSDTPGVRVMPCDANGSRSPCEQRGCRSARLQRCAACVRRRPASNGTASCSRSVSSRRVCVDPPRSRRSSATAFRLQSRQYAVTAAVPTTPGWKASTNRWASRRVRK